MKKSLVRSLTSTLALSIALAACTKTVDRGLNQEEQAKLDGISAREADVAKAKEDLAAKEAELNQKTADLQAQASSLDSEKQRIEQEKIEFNSKLAQLESDRKQAEELQVSLAKESAALNEKQQRAEAEDMRLQEITRQQAESKAKIAQQQAQLSEEQAKIEQSSQALEAKEAELRANVQKLNTEVQATQQMLQGEDGLNVILKQIGVGQPAQVLVMILGSGQCANPALRAIQTKVSALDKTPYNERIQDEKYGASVCGARYLVKTDSAAELANLRKTVIDSGYMFAAFPLREIRSKSFLTVETNKGWTWSSTELHKIQIYDSGIRKVHGVMTKAELEAVSGWSGFPKACGTEVTTECLGQLDTMNDGDRAKVKGLLESSSNEASRELNFADKVVGSSAVLVTGMTITHEVYAIGPKRSTVLFPETMPAGFLSTEFGGDFLAFKLPLRPVLANTKLEINRAVLQERKAYVQAIDSYSKALTKK